MQRVARGGRQGLTLIEVIVTIAVLSIIAVPITLNYSASSRGGGESARLDNVALKLAKLADAAGRFSGIQAGSPSYAQTLFLGGGTNPGRLSYLTNEVTAASVNSCGGTITSGTTLWKGPFYNWALSTAGFKIADGFFADDTLSRYDSVGNVRKVPPSSTNQNRTSWGTLAIVMQDVSRSDAVGLRTRVEGASTATTGSVRFADTGDPVTVYYHFNIHGC
jgi:prepilin-type N-terminal cleavage/methylation domain-containing protein